MILLLLLAAAFVAYRLWTALNRLESTIASLKTRVETLEQWRFTHPPQPTPAPERVAEQVVDRPQPPPVAATAPAATTSVATSVGPSIASAPPVQSRSPIPPLPSSPPASSSAAPREPQPAPAPAPTPKAPRRSPSPEGLETRIGARWLLYVGVVAIIVGVSYFEKLAIDNGWIGETTRVLQGAVAGLLLVVGGLQFVRKGYRLYGQIVSGGGIAILYVSTYASFNFYSLISQPVAFGLMSAVTVLAAWLADRQRSQALALVAVGGGFATPFLLPASTDAEAALFGYDAFLIAGTMFLSRRRDRPTLNVVSYAFTVLTFTGWAARFYAPSKYLTTELFLTLFCAMYLYILNQTRHSGDPLARAGRAILWTAPVGYYLVSLAILSDHSPALLVYLILLSLAGVIAGARAGSRIRLVFWIAVSLPLLVWSAAHGMRVWLIAGLSAWTGVYLLNLAGLLEGTIWRQRRFAAADIALLHLTGLVAFAGAYLLINPVRSIAAGPLAFALALLNGALALALAKRWRDQALHFGALGFTLMTIAVALEFEGAWIITGWAAEGAAIVWLGLRERKEWLQGGGLALFAVAVLWLMALQFSDPPIGQLPLANPVALSGLFVVAMTYGMTAAHRRYAQPEYVQAAVGIGLTAAKLLLLALAASEIVGYWKLHDSPPFEPDAQLIAAALAAGTLISWLGLRRRQEWIRAVGGVIVLVAVLNLLVIQLQPAPTGYLSILNARAAAGVVAVLVLYGLAVIHRRLGAHVGDLPVNIAVLTTGASLLTLSLLTSEIDAFWAARGAADTGLIARQGLKAIAWGSIGSFLIWQGLSSGRGWIRAIGGTLIGVSVIRLLSVQFAETWPAYVVGANARVIASLVLISLLYGLARLYGRTGDAPEHRFAPATVLWLIANALTLTLLTSEITAYWHVQDMRHSSSFAANSQFARGMMISITWAVYATLMIVVGLRRHYRPIRYFAMTVFVLTIVKVFVIDLAELDRIYRVLSVIVLGLMLLLTSYLYHKLSDEPEQA